MDTFASYDRASPTIPPDTCPDINAVQSDVDSAVKVVERVRDELEEASNLLDALTGKRGNLEELRTQNEELRECGKYWREAAREMGETIDGLKLELESYQHKEAAVG